MLNNVTLMGRLTAAPELKTTLSGGTSVTTFTLAIDRRFQQNGEKQADFINCIAWRTTAEFICRYFGKGDMLAITGEIQTRKYTDKDGKNRVAVEVIANQASFCGSKNNAQNAPQEATAQSNFEEIGSEEDLPF